jgi:hypothetical protein
MNPIGFRGLVCFGVLLCGCSKNGPAVKFDDVVAIEEDAPLAVPLSPLRPVLLNALKDAHWKLAETDDAWKLKATAQAQFVKPASVTVEAQFEFRKHAESVRIDVLRRAASEPTVEAKTQAAQTLVKEVFLEAAERGKMEIELTTLSDAALAEFFAKQGPETRSRDVALTLLARRRQSAALVPLLKKFASAAQTQKVDEVRSALGLLVELKNPAAVNPMIEALEGKDGSPEFVFAIASIGGPDAEAYLELMAEGHSVSIIREAAQRGLEDLRAMKKRNQHQ